MLRRPPDPRIRNLIKSRKLPRDPPAPSLSVPLLPEGQYSLQGSRRFSGGQKLDATPKPSQDILDALFRCPITQV